MIHFLSNSLRRPPCLELLVSNPRLSSISRTKSLSILLSFFLAPSLLPAAEPAFAKLLPPAKESPWVGERVDFTVEVGVRGRFSGSTTIDLPQVSGAILMKPEERPVLATRQIDGEEFTIQQHGFSLFSQRPGDLQVPAFQVRCGSIRALNEPEQEHQLEVAGFTVATTLPEGARPGQVVVTTTSLAITESWDPQPAEAMAGDAFRRTVTLRSEDLPGMILPRLPTPKVPGLARYPDQAQVHDQTERGAFTGTRTDRVTYLCETPGTITIPGVEYRWWNPDKRSWETKALPAVTLKVAPNPAYQHPDAGIGPAPSQSTSSWGWFLAGIVVLAGAITGFLIRRHSPDPATAAYKELAAACTNGTASTAYQAFHRWRTIAGRPGEPLPAPLQEQLLAAQQSIIDPARPWTGHLLLKESRAWRRRHPRDPHRSPQAIHLPNLNSHRQDQAL